jgi:Na+/citrate or Na+/malate symporter
MTDRFSQHAKLQWKWVGITLAMYFSLYLFPIFIISIFFKNTIAIKLIGGWMFGGIIIVAALAGYLSKGITIWEPAIAGTGLILGIFVCVIVYTRIINGERLNVVTEFLEILIPTFIVFLLSLLGAWIGERAQKLWKKESLETH